MIQCSCGFLRSLSTEFAACSKPPSRDNHRKRLIQGRNNVTRVRVEPRSFNQGRHKNNAFTYAATLMTIPIRPRCRQIKGVI